MDILKLGAAEVCENGQVGRLELFNDLSVKHADELRVVFNVVSIESFRDYRGRAHTIRVHVRDDLNGIVSMFFDQLCGFLRVGEQGIPN